MLEKFFVTPERNAISLGYRINPSSSFSTNCKSDMESDGSSCTEHSEESLGTEFSQYKTGNADSVLVLHLSP